MRSAIKKFWTRKYEGTIQKRPYTNVIVLFRMHECYLLFLMKWPELEWFFQNHYCHLSGRWPNFQIRADSYPKHHFSQTYGTEQHLLLLPVRMKTWLSNTFISFVVCRGRSRTDFKKKQSKEEQSETYLCVGTKRIGIYRKYNIWRLYISWMH
jgi:hypothetical protein